VSHSRIEFRRSEALGANALALPSGVVVVTDGLVALAKDTDDVVAVLAHEVGHLEGRHSMRAIVQSALVSGLIMLVVGDVSALAAAAPAALLNARYSRDLEREADAYASDALRAIGVRPTRLADMLERMEAEHSKAGREGPTDAFSYLSTHPTTEERLTALRRGSEKRN
jgi:Zn-dependent protease with chaperone function